MIAVRTCRDCGVEKPLTIAHWYSKPAREDGFETLCKACTKAAMKRKQLAASPEKVCVACLKVFPLEQFLESRKNRDGYRRRCKACERQRDKECRAGARAGVRRVEQGSNKPCKFCPGCAGLPHRVTGAKCSLCGLAYETEAKPELQTRRA
jgi:hypothetical protein